MEGPGIFCTYTLINHSRQELHHDLHLGDDAAEILGRHEAGLVDETRHWFLGEPEEIELDYCERDISQTYAARIMLYLLKDKTLEGYKVL